ncbi:MAG: hypothetical protein V4813_13110 [Gemmatimonadota bacterium]
MLDKVKRWTTVGSAGTVDESSLTLVTLTGAVVALKGLGPLNPGAAPPGDLSRERRTVVIRYNVTPVDGAFDEVTAAHPIADACSLMVRYRDGGASSQIVIRLIQLDMTTGIETEFVRFDSNTFPQSAGFQLQTAVGMRRNMDFAELAPKAYYLDASLTGRAIPLEPENQTAAIAAIKIVFVTSDPFD